MPWLCVHAVYFHLREVVYKYVYVYTYFYSYKILCGMQLIPAANLLGVYIATASWVKAVALNEKYTLVSDLQ